MGNLESSIKAVGSPSYAKRNSAQKDKPRKLAIEVDGNNLKRHVENLASNDRNADSSDTSGILRAEIYISDQLRSYGYKEKTDVRNQPVFFFQDFMIERVAGIGNNFSITPACNANSERNVEIKGETINIGSFCPSTSSNAKKVSNIIVRIPGKNRNRKIILGAHYDSRGGVGANDNSTGVAALLEAARLLSKGKPEYDIEIVFFTGEELGTLGSKYYLQQMSANEKSHIVGVFIVDMIGNNKSDGEPDSPEDLDLIYSQNNSTSKALAVKMGEVIAKTSKIKPRLSFESARREIPILTGDRGFFGMNEVSIVLYSTSDNEEFERNGIPTVLISEDTSDEQNDYYHSAGDKPDYIDYNFLKESTEAIIVSIVALAKF